MGLFHYTDGNALLSILKNKKLWLTHIKYMNDSSEYTHGKNILFEQIQHLIKEKTNFHCNIAGVNSVNEHAHIFVGSFCSSAIDNLSQWRGYGSYNGCYAIEFNAKISKHKKKCIYNISEQVDAATKHASRITKISEKYFKKLRTDQPYPLDHPIQQELISTNLEAHVEIARFKHKGFEEEKEHRIILIAVDDYEGTSNKILFRNRNGLIIPFVEYEIPLNSFKRIWIGPMKEQELAEHSLNMFIDSLEWNGKRPEVKCSKIPYRE